MEIKSTLLTSERGNNYIVSQAIPQVLLLHPISNYLMKLSEKGIILEDWIAQQPEDSEIEVESGLISNKQEIRYYYEYLKFLEKNNYFKEIKAYELTEDCYSAEFIEAQIANTNQIVFECTSACGLRCKYCGYGDLYKGHDNRKPKELDIILAKKLFDYIIDRLESPLNRKIHERIALSFYGGEPLLNMHFIKEMVAYVKSKKVLKKVFFFSMTTNGLDINKHMDFLVENDFMLLISLDGNEKNNAYRVRPDGSSSFKKVYNNVLELKKKYPGYYEERVRFTSVLHNKNSNKEIRDFFETHFGKTPIINEVKSYDLKTEKKLEFDRMFKGKFTGLTPQDIINDINDKRKIFDTPFAVKLVSFLNRHSGFVFKSYNQLLLQRENYYYVSTGTCFPFERKIFLTVDGKILPCERINQIYTMGNVDEEGVHLDFHKIAEKYNAYFKKLMNQCNHCLRSNGCKMCIFYLNIEENNPSCPSYYGLSEFKKALINSISLLEENPKYYVRILRDYQEQ